MKDSLNVLVTGVWHIRPGKEATFIRIWKEKMCKLAQDMQSEHPGLFHNEQTDAYLSSILFPSKEKAEEFLSSEKLAKITQELNLLCLIPVRRELYDILPEAI